jgi:hypothetical protein
VEESRQHGNQPSGFHKMLGHSLIAERLEDSGKAGQKETILKGRASTATKCSFLVSRLTLLFVVLLHALIFRPL